MKYKLIASDFDGTIYTDDYHIASGTAEAIADYVKAGGIMMISTGRLYKSIKQHLPSLGLNSGAVIVEQGSNVVDIATDELVLNYTIPTALAYECLRDIESAPDYVGMMYYKGDCYAPERTPVIDFFESIIQVPVKFVHEPVSEYMKRNNIEPTKVLGISNPGCQGDYPLQWTKKYNGELTFSRSNGILTEVVTKYAGKGNALKYLAEEVYHLKREEVIAIGDAENDLTMIKYAGLGVAVGNAMQIVKDKADVVVESNDESGVAKTIRRYGLGENI